jgi:hypothetical protein
MWQQFLIYRDSVQNALFRAKVPLAMYVTYSDLLSRLQGDQSSTPNDGLSPTVSNRIPIHRKNNRPTVKTPLSGKELV